MAGSTKGKGYPKRAVPGTPGASDTVDPITQAATDLYDLLFPSASAGTGGETTTPKGGEPTQTVGVSRGNALQKAKPKSQYAPQPAPQTGVQPPEMMRQPTDTLYGKPVDQSSPSLADVFGQAFAGMTPPAPNPMRMAGQGAYTPPTAPAAPALNPGMPTQNPLLHAGGMGEGGMPDQGVQGMFPLGQEQPDDAMTQFLRMMSRQLAMTGAQ